MKDIKIIKRMLMIFLIIAFGAIAAYKTGILDTVFLSLKTHNSQHNLDKESFISKQENNQADINNNNYQNTVSVEPGKMMKIPAIYAYKYGETIEVKSGDKITYSGRTNVSFIFDGKINEDEMRKHIKLQPVFEPEQIYVGETDDNKTLLYFNIVDEGDNKKPDYYSLTILKGLKDSEDNVLSQDIIIKFIKKEHPVAEISLVDNKSGVELPYSVYVSDEEKTFVIKFSKDINKQSAENTIKQNIFNGYSIHEKNSHNMPVLEFIWESPRILNLKIKSLQPDKWYQVSITGTEDLEGCKVMESQYYLGKIEHTDTIYDLYIFKTGSKQYIWKQNLATGTKDIITAVPQNRYACGSLSPDGNWISLGRFTSLEGDLYLHKPVFFNLNSQEYIYTNDVYSYEDIKWYNTKAYALLNNGSGFNINEKETSVVFRRRNNYPAGIMPYPDDNLIAAFTYDQETRKIALNIVSAQNFDSTDGYDANIIKSIAMPFFCKLDADGIYTRPLTFEWLDENTIITEGWEKDNIKSHIYKIDIRTGKVAIFITNAMRPMISKDKNKIAVIRMDYKQRQNYASVRSIEFFDRDGKPLNKGSEGSTIPEKYLGKGFNTDVTMMWTDSSEKFYIFNTSDFYCMKNKYIISYDVDSGKISKSEVPENENYIVAGITNNGKEIICTNSNPLPRN